MKKTLASIIALAPLFLPAVVLAQNYGDDCQVTACGSGLTCNYATNQCECPAGQTWTGATCVTGGSGTQTTGGTNPSNNSGALNVGKLLGYKTDILRIVDGILVPLLIAIAFFVFLYGVFNYLILGAANEEKRKEGRIFVMYGIVGFVIIFTLWGIVHIITDVLNLTGTSTLPPPYPQI